MEALNDGLQIDRIFIQVGTRGEFEKDLRSICKERLIPLVQVPKEKIAKYYNGNHQGVMAFISSIPIYRLYDVLPTVYEQGRNPLFILLDGVTDVRNFGAIARSAEVLGADGIVLGRKNTAQINADALKISAGALSKIAVCREPNLLEAVSFLRESGCNIIAADGKSDNLLPDQNLTDGLGIILGSEERGVSKELRNLADMVCAIPQSGKTESLNVSVAAGLFLYEVLRQRRNAINRK